MSKCVQCGYCCTVRPCPYGVWDPDKEQCAYLTEDTKCSKYNEIIKDPSSVFSPAFGTGCCSSLFNEVRDRKIEELKREGV